jgi:hypothetical protein
MKRSGQVGLVVMGAAAFVGTYASIAAYRAGTTSSQPQSAMAQTCTTRPDGTQACEPARRSFGYYFIPHFAHGWWYGNGSAAKPQPAAFAGNAPAAKPQPAAFAGNAPAAKPQPAAFAGNAPAPAAKTQSVALTSTARPYSPSASGAERGGFGTSASSSFRTSAGG